MLWLAQACSWDIYLSNKLNRKRNKMCSNSKKLYLYGNKDKVKYKYMCFAHMSHILYNMINRIDKGVEQEYYSLRL